MSEIKIEAVLRTETGKNKVDKIRVNNEIPAVMYQKGEESRSLKVSVSEFDRVYKIAGNNSILDLVVEGNTYPVLIKEIQKHPWKEKYVHVDFQVINMKEKISVEIPVILTGKEFIQDKTSVLMQGINVLHIECLPGNIPDHVEYDVSALTHENAVHVKDLEIFNSDTITVLTDPEELVAHLTLPAEEVEAEEVSAAEVPVIGEKAE